MEYSLLKQLKQNWNLDGAWIGLAGSKKSNSKYCRTCRFFQVSTDLPTRSLALCMNPETKLGYFSKHPIGFIQLDAIACFRYKSATSRSTEDNANA